MQRDVIDLYSLQSMIRASLEDVFPDRIWVKAEISSVSVKANGHCYLDLVESREGSVAAKAKAVIWRSRYLLLGKAFEEMTGSPLTAGMTILARVQVSYSEIYGLTLSIDDLDAVATLGEQEKIRRETIAKLEKEGLLDAQQQLEFPLLPYRLAVISAPGAAGWGDFRRHLEENPYGFKYKVELFEAVMQGPSAPESISDALAAVSASKEPWDAALILRGGGSAFDLSCFDDYGLCFNIATCPIPVLTAIGHDRDTHVADMVAFSAVKTPTALADVFIDAFAAEDERISSFTTRLRLAFNGKISAMESKAELLLSRIKAADPRSVLSRGYTLVTDSRGVIIKSASLAEEGARIGVLFRDGKLNCTVDGKV